MFELAATELVLLGQESNSHTAEACGAMAKESRLPAGRRIKVGEVSQRHLQITSCSNFWGEEEWGWFTGRGR